MISFHYYQSIRSKCLIIKSVIIKILQANTKLWRMKVYTIAKCPIAKSPNIKIQESQSYHKTKKNLWKMHYIAFLRYVCLWCRLRFCQCQRAFFYQTRKIKNEVHLGSIFCKTMLMSWQIKARVYILNKLPLAIHYNRYY